MPLVAAVRATAEEEPVSASLAELPSCGCSAVTVEFARGSEASLGAGAGSARAAPGGKTVGAAITGEADGVDGFDDDFEPFRPHAGVWVVALAPVGGGGAWVVAGAGVDFPPAGCDEEDDFAAGSEGEPVGLDTAAADLEPADVAAPADFLWAPTLVGLDGARGSGRGKGSGRMALPFVLAVPCAPGGGT